MKNRYFLCFALTLLCFFESDAQSYKYSFQVEDSDADKLVLTNLTEGLWVKDRFITKDTLTFVTPSNFSFEEFRERCISRGYDSLVYFNKVKSSVSFVHEKSGNTDCEGATQICSDATFNGNSSNNSYQDLNSTNSGCTNVFVESSPNWYYINIETGGTLELTLNPTVNNADIDFALWGPFTSATAALNCPPISAPIRLGVASPVFTGIDETGMVGCAPGGGSGCTPSTHAVSSTSEGCPTGNGDAWVAPINASSGDIYILLVNNYSNTGNYSVDWGGTAVIGCTPVVLGVELNLFEVIKHHGNVVNWQTLNERNNSHFILERSTDGFQWGNIALVAGHDISTEVINYSFIDYGFEMAKNYYRLTQVDFDGKTELLGVRYVDNRIEKQVVQIYNLLGQVVSETEMGWLIYVFDDGTTQKIYRY